MINKRNINCSLLFNIDYIILIVIAQHSLIVYHTQSSRCQNLPLLAIGIHCFVTKNKNIQEIKHI